MYTRILVCGLLAVTLAAGCGGGSQSCVGTDRCACNPNGTCNTGLSCLSNMCVTAPADAGIDVPATGGSSAAGAGVAGTTGTGGTGVAGTGGAPGAAGRGGSGVAGASGGGGIAGAAGGRGGTGGTTGAAGTGGVTGPLVCRFDKDGVQQVHEPFAYVTLARGAATVSCNSGGRSLRFTVTSTTGSIEARTYSCSDSAPVSVTMIYDDIVGIAYWANWTVEGLGQPCMVTFEQLSGGRARGTFSGMLRGRRSDNTLETINVTGGVFDLIIM